MCRQECHIYSVCAHCSVSIQECSDYSDRLDKSRRFCDHTCKQVRPVPSYGFCPSCADRFAVGPFPLHSETLVRNFWSYKASCKWYMAVDPLSVPREATFLPYPEGGVWKSTRVVSTRKDGASRRHEVRYEELAIMNAVGQQAECSERCRHCRGRDLSVNVSQFAIMMRIGTLNWCRVSQFLGQQSSEQQQQESNTPGGTDGDQPGSAGMEEKELDKLLSTIVVNEDACHSPRRFSHPDLAPMALVTNLTGGAARQNIESPKRQPSPSDTSSVDWLDESL